MTALTEPQLVHASRSLPRYTSYPTALAFEPAPDDVLPRGWLSAIQPTDLLSIYVHVPFCERLCWYCGCHTSVPNGYDRISGFLGHLGKELDLWADATPAHAGVAHIHFGGGSPNALSTDDFSGLLASISRRFALRRDAEVAVELDPGHLDRDFARSLGAAGVTRASLGVQTLDPAVQRLVNRIQPFERVEAAVTDIRAGGVAAVSFDMMYGLPGQNPDNVADSLTLALTLAPDRVALFGYAHVPWMKKHQAMIRQEDLADVAGRWSQAEAAEAVLLAHDYVRIGMDHFARPDDPMARQLANGGLRRNFQGYTDDPARVLIGLGPSAISAFPQGYAQNASRVDQWAGAVEGGRLPVARQLAMTAEHRLRGAVIERLMCELEVDVGAVCLAEGYAIATLDDGVIAARALASDGLCTVEGRVIRVPSGISRLVRAVAACFDQHSAPVTNTYSLAI
jgi:oxygen-independent coproporphyrinogen-3 oxidase